LRSRIESAVSEFSLQVRGSGQARVGISVGTATFGADGETLDQLLVAADQAMYRAKSSHKLDKLSLDKISLDKISMETKPSAVVIELDTTTSRPSPSTSWSALTCQRFSRPRLVAASSNNLI